MKQREQRIRRIRAVVQGTAERPRLMIERTNLHLRAQVIDDAQGHTLVYANDTELKDATVRGTKRAQALGELVGTRSKEAGITTLVFDRRGHAYHGQVAAFVDAVRAAGITL